MTADLAIQAADGLGPGGYRFRDCLRVGVPPTALVVVATLELLS
jgi:di/tricarboxylate transporter